MNNIQIIETEVNPLTRQVNEMNLVGEDDKIKASDLLSSLTLYLDRLTADKELITKPLNESLRAVRGKYKPLETILGTSIDQLRAKIGQYQTNALKLQEIEQAKIANRIGEGKGHIKVETAMKKIADLPQVTKRTDDITFRTDKVLKITDITLIPDEFFDLNESKLLKVLREGATISGATLEDKQTVIIKR